MIESRKQICWKDDIRSLTGSWRPHSQKHFPNHCADLVNQRYNLLTSGNQMMTVGLMDSTETKSYELPRLTQPLMRPACGLSCSHYRHLSPESILLCSFFPSLASVLESVYDQQKLRWYYFNHKELGNKGFRIICVLHKTEYTSLAGGFFKHCTEN